MQFRPPLLLTLDLAFPESNALFHFWSREPAGLSIFGDHRLLSSSTRLVATVPQSSVVVTIVPPRPVTPLRLMEPAPVSRTCKMVPRDSPHLLSARSVWSNFGVSVVLTSFYAPSTTSRGFPGTLTFLPQLWLLLLPPYARLSRIRRPPRLASHFLVCQPGLHCLPLPPLLWFLLLLPHLLLLFVSLFGQAIIPWPPIRWFSKWTRGNRSGLHAEVE